MSLNGMWMPVIVECWIWSGCMVTGIEFVTVAFLELLWMRVENDVRQLTIMKFIWTLRA